MFRQYIFVLIVIYMQNIVYPAFFMKQSFSKNFISIQISQNLVQQTEYYFSFYSIYFRKEYLYRNFQMKFLKICLLLGLYTFTAQSTFDVFTTSHTELTRGGRVKKDIKPQEHFCSDQKIQKQRCKTNKDACKNAGTTTQSSVCAYDRFGVKFDFNKQCEACENQNVKYYFMGSCQKAPQICKSRQQCVNGLCIELLQESEHAGREICNTKVDCSSLSAQCVANKCIQMSDLRKVLKSAQVKNPKLVQKQEKVRKQFKKRQIQRKVKQQQDVYKIRAQIQARKQSGSTDTSLRVNQQSAIVSN